MLVCSFSSDSRIFFAYGDITITGEGLQTLTYTRHSWLLSNIKSGIEKIAIYFSEIILGQVLMLNYVLRFVLLCYLDINMSPILYILDFEQQEKFGSNRAIKLLNSKKNVENLKFFARIVAERFSSATKNDPQLARHC